MLFLRRRRYAPEAYQRYRRHLRKSLRFGAIWFGSLGAVLVLAILLLSQGFVFAMLAGLTTAVLALSLLITLSRATGYLFPQLMPYFSVKLPGTGFAIGYRLVRYSRALDELAVELQLRPLGSFVSDDDLIDGGTPAWQPARDALATVSGLLERGGAAPSVLAARRDLEHLRDRLGLAVEQNAEFCLLFRDATGTNAMEWAIRAGSP